MTLSLITRTSSNDTNTDDQQPNTHKTHRENNTIKALITTQFIFFDSYFFSFLVVADFVVFFVVFFTADDFFAGFLADAFVIFPDGHDFAADCGEPNCAINETQSCSVYSSAGFVFGSLIGCFPYAR